MTQVRRVTRLSGTSRTSRPDGITRSVARDVEVARTAVVTPLFPTHAPARPKGLSPVEAAQVTNIFADLDDDATRPAASPLARARARMAARLPGADVPVITNIFVEDCPDVSDEMMTEVEAKLRRHPRKLTRARAELRAAHAERLEQSRTLANIGPREAGRIAAGMMMALAMLHLVPMPHA